MDKFFTAAAAALLTLTLTGCSSAPMPANDSAENLDLSGWVMLGKAETVNKSTLSPQGRIIIGRVSCKTRQVAIPADSKVPFTGSYRKVTTESLLGTRETIIEYDFTANTATEAQTAQSRLEKFTLNSK